MTDLQKQNLILALIARGYNYIDARNVAYGDPTVALQRFTEYCTNPVDIFFAQWLNKGADFDKVYGHQCVDVFKFYNRDVAQGSPVKGNAIDYWTNYDPKFYTAIKNTPFNYPRKGDVLIFKATKNLPVGHIEVVKEGNVIAVEAFGQNWPLTGYYDKKGNFIGTGVCHFYKHGYISNPVIGWLRPLNLA